MKKLLLTTIVSIALITAFQAKALTIENDSDETVTVKTECLEARGSFPEKKYSFNLSPRKTRSIGAYCCNIEVRDSKGNIVIRRSRVCGIVRITKLYDKWHVG
jgi:hypothetical protein